MQQFIPFDDNWDAVARISLEDLIAYRVGMSLTAQRRAECAQQGREPALGGELIAADSGAA